MTNTNHQSDVVIGIDLGTTGVKVVALDPRSAATVATAGMEYPSSSPVPGAHEQDPNDWWDATVQALRLVTDGLGPARVCAVGLSGHMHSLLLVDEGGVPVAPVMTWADRRVSEDTARLTAAGPFLQVAGNDVVDAFTAPKLSWLARHSPELLARAHRLVLAKDYLRFRLTGSWATDETDAIGTLLYDVHQRRWSEDLWATSGADLKLAPRVTASTDIAGTVTSAAAQATGLPAGTPIVAGAGDVSSAVLGTGTVTQGQICINAGTAAQVMGLSPTPHPGSGFMFGAATGTDFIVMASVYAAGASVKWAGRAFLGDDDINTVAAGAAAGSDGLVYLPFMFGSAVPKKNDAARAALIGQTERHGRAEMARAVLEGVAFGCADAVAAVAAEVGPPREVRIVGGVSESKIWQEALASVLEAKVIHMPTGGSVYGAAVLAGLGIGAWPDAGSATAIFKGDEIKPPGLGQVTAYRRSYDLYKNACARLL